ncbi:MAG: hypothetical protein INQ03_21870 [Candidatus Heimdallarchaeota archaeon]|nr:hypothetical protein [Candidatus Heimdallarchaeota archaeon]
MQLLLPIDFRFIVYIFMGFVGLAVLFRNLLYYKKTRSVDYLLVGIFFFQISTVFTFTVYTKYFMQNPSLRDLWRYYFHQSDAFWQILWYNIPINIFWAIGMLCTIIHTFRTLNFKARSRSIRVLFAIISIELVLQALYFIILYLSWLSKDFSIILNTSEWSEYNIDRWYYRLWFSQLLFTPMLALNIGHSVMYLQLGLAYIFSRHEISSPQLRIPRSIWIFFSITFSFTWILNGILWLYGDTGPWRLLYDFNNILRLLAFMSIAYVVFFKPETILISRYQVIKAYDIYKKMGLLEKKQQLLEINRFVSYFEMVMPIIRLQIRQEEDADNAEVLAVST